MANDTVLGTYSPNEVTMLINVDGNTHIVSGFATGTFINISRMTAAATLNVGSDLTAFRVKKRNRASTIEVTLHQAATSNLIFQQIQKSDEEDATDTYVFPVTIKDGSGLSIYYAAQAFIGTQAASSFSDGETGENRVWTIHAVNLDSQVGGNTKMDQAAVAVVENLGGNVDARWRL